MKWWVLFDSTPSWLSEQLLQSAYRHKSLFNQLYLHNKMSSNNQCTSLNTSCRIPRKKWHSKLFTMVYFWWKVPTRVHRVQTTYHKLPLENSHSWYRKRERIIIRNAKGQMSRPGIFKSLIQNCPGQSLYGFSS